MEKAFSYNEVSPLFFLSNVYYAKQEMLYGVSYQGCLLLFQITIKKAICLQENIETNDFGYDL
ncbi:hypothetical protein [Longicatena caecimuris]|uniref:hypothetical protein n=1 Tax=Longicatena caecimuris TaxID=1796635 RepID=UPI00214AB62C|nr:hypothetical protein [Longicatena caecimuris]